MPTRPARASARKHLRFIEGLKNQAAPDGFVITSDAFLHALGTAGVRTQLQQLLVLAQNEEPAVQDVMATQMQGIVQGVTMPAALCRAIADAYARLGENAPVTVRATVRSDAELHDAFAAVSGLGALLQRVRDCWASSYSVAELAQRKRRRSSAEIAPSVVVQRYVDTSR